MLGAMPHTLLREWQAYYRRKERIALQGELAAKSAAAVETRVKKGRR